METVEEVHERDIESAAPDAEPLLDLDTIAPKRATVRIRTRENPDGRLYELRLHGDFGIAEQQQLARDGDEFDKLYGKKLTHKEGQRLKMLLDRMFDKVFDAPADVKAQLDDQQRSQVVMAFTFAPFRTAAQNHQTDKTETVEGSTSDI